MCASSVENSFRSTTALISRFLNLIIFKSYLNWFCDSMRGYFQVRYTADTIKSLVWSRATQICKYYRCCLMLGLRTTDSKMSVQNDCWMQQTTGTVKAANKNREHYTRSIKIVFQTLSFTIIFSNSNSPQLLLVPCDPLEVIFFASSILLPLWRFLELSTQYNKRHTHTKIPDSNDDSKV